MPIFGQKMPVLGQIWPFLSPKIQFFWGQGVKNFGTLISGFQWDTFFRVENIDHLRLQLAARGENVLFWPQNLDIWGQKSIFCLVNAILLMEQMITIPRATTFPSEPPQKNFRFRATGHFFGAHPCFWPFWASDTTEVQLPLILVRFQRNSREPSGPSKKWPRRTTDLVRAGITEKRAFLRSAEKWFLA